MRNLLPAARAVAVTASALSVALFVFPARAATADDETCLALTKLTNERDAEGHKTSALGVRADGMAISCSVRTVEFKYTTAKRMPSGWRELKVQEFDALFCTGVSLEDIRRGWTIALSITLEDGTRFWHKATCNT